MKLFFLSALIALAVGAAAQSPAPGMGHWTPRRVVVPAASRVDISHLGVHTHADLLLFPLSAQSVAALQGGPQFRAVRVVAHCRLPTDQAALPPGFGWLTKDAGPIPTSGAIDGDPGWSISPLFQEGGRDFVKVSVPTRFANWVAGQPPAVQKRYRNRQSYSLEITWEEQG